MTTNLIVPVASEASSQHSSSYSTAAKWCLELGGAVRRIETLTDAEVPHKTAVGVDLWIYGFLLTEICGKFFLA